MFPNRCIVCLLSQLIIAAYSTANGGEITLITYLAKKKRIPLYSRKDNGESCKPPS